MGVGADAGFQGGQSLRISRPRLAGAATAALVASLLAWLLAGNYDDLSATQRERGTGVSSIPVSKPVAVSVEQLRALANSLGYPIYWAGARPGSSYELTRMADGRVFIRYLPSGVAAGDPRLVFSFVATYPDSNAFARVRRAARRKDAIRRRVAAGGLAVADEGGGEIVRSTKQPLPTAPVFFAHPGSEVLVELYDPTGISRAFHIVSSGLLRPIR
jgi:hypothetical protein